MIWKWKSRFATKRDNFLNIDEVKAMKEQERLDDVVSGRILDKDKKEIEETVEFIDMLQGMEGVSNSQIRKAMQKDQFKGKLNRTIDNIFDTTLYRTVEDTFPNDNISRVLR